MPWFHDPQTSVCVPASAQRQELARAELTIEERDEHIADLEAQPRCGVVNGATGDKERLSPQVRMPRYPSAPAGDLSKWKGLQLELEQRNAEVAALKNAIAETVTFHLPPSQEDEETGRYVLSAFDGDERGMQTDIDASVMNELADARAILDAAEEAGLPLPYVNDDGVLAVPKPQLLVEASAGPTDDQDDTEVASGQEVSAQE